MKTKMLGAILSILYILFVSVGLAEDNHEEDDFLLLTVPSITAASIKPIPPEPIKPRWSVITDVCCPDSTDTFKVIQGGDSRSSTSPSCSVPSQQSSEVITEAGNKAFTWTHSSPVCGTVGSNFSFTLEEATRYLIVAVWNGSNVVLELYAGSIAAAIDESKSTVSPELNLLKEFKVSSVNLTENNKFRAVNYSRK